MLIVSIILIFKLTIVRFKIIQQLLQDQFLYGGIASLGDCPDFRLGERIYNEKYIFLKPDIEPVLEISQNKLNKDSSFKFIEYMTENKITVMYIKLEKRTPMSMWNWWEMILAPMPSSLK